MAQRLDIWSDCCEISSLYGNYLLLDIYFFFSFKFPVESSKYDTLYPKNKKISAASPDQSLNTSKILELPDGIQIFKNKIFFSIFVTNILMLKNILHFTFHYCKI